MKFNDRVNRLTAIYPGVCARQLCQTRWRRRTYSASRREDRKLVLLQYLRQLMISYVPMLARIGQLTPKSANANSASSALLLNKMFSGFKSTRSASRLVRTEKGRLTSMDNTLIVQILDCTCNGPDDVLGIPGRQS